MGRLHWVTYDTLGRMVLGAWGFIPNGRTEWLHAFCSLPVYVWHVILNPQIYPLFMTYKTPYFVYFVPLIIILFTFHTTPTLLYFYQFSYHFIYIIHIILYHFKLIIHIDLCIFITIIHTVFMFHAPILNIFITINYVFNNH